MNHYWWLLQHSQTLTGIITMIVFHIPIIQTNNTIPLSIISNILSRCIYDVKWQQICCSKFIKNFIECHNKNIQLLITKSLVLMMIPLIINHCPWMMFILRCWLLYWEHALDTFMVKAIDSFIMTHSATMERMKLMWMVITCVIFWVTTPC